MNNYCKYGENCAFTDRENELKIEKWALIIKQNHVNNFLKIIFVIIEVDVNLVIKENITIVLMLVI